MKLLRTIPLLLLLGLPCFALREKAIAAFMVDAQVRAARQIASEDYEVSVDPEAIFIEENCGYAGCFSTYLLSLTVGPRAQFINPQSWAIVAQVKVHDGNFPPIVKLLRGVKSETFLRKY